MRVLVTGASGKLGSVVCRELLRRDHDVVATDLVASDRDQPPIHTANLLEDAPIYQLMRGCEAVVHLGNHPHAHARHPAQRLLAENTQMNANVFHAALDLDLRRIVFASSIQTMSPANKGWGENLRCEMPYLPLDGDAPANPGTNAYAISKVLAERMLAIYSGSRASLAATALRFPYLLSTEAADAIRAGEGAHRPRQWLNFNECLTYLILEDAARLIDAVLTRQQPGYHQYFPAQSLHLRGLPTEALIDRHYAHVPLRRPATQLDGLVDLEPLRRDLDWAPAGPPLEVVDLE